MLGLFFRAFKSLFKHVYLFNKYLVSVPSYEPGEYFTDIREGQDKFCASILVYGYGVFAVFFFNASNAFNCYVIREGPDCLFSF